MRWSVLVGATLLAVAARAAPVCAPPSGAAPALERLRSAMAAGRFVGYQPTSLQVIDGKPTRADPTSIRADLTILRPRFDSLLTYGALNGAEEIPGAAAALNFRTLIIGVWNPFNPLEVDAALDAAARYPQLVAGLALGNELVFAGRRGAPELAARIAAIRTRAPAVPLSTTEPFHMFRAPDAPAVLAQLDFLLANVHPVFQPWFRGAPDANAAKFVVGVVDDLATRYCGPILVRETGVPTAPAAAGFNPERQASFYRELARAFPPSAERAFAYFAAFDAPWRVADQQAAPGTHPEEAHWGLYDARRVAKPVIALIAPLAPAAGR